MMDGSQDIARSVNRLRSGLPAALAPLAAVAYNYRWAWSARGPALFRRIGGAAWERSGENPVLFLREALDSIERATQEPELIRVAGQLAAELEADLARPWSAGGPTPERPVAFFCAEYGVHASLPIYAGGLGALAGDYLKQASDSATPLVAVGLLYRQGYFHQRLDSSGWQHEHWIETSGEILPCARVTDVDGRALTVEVPVEERRVRAFIWRVNVGRIPLYLLDSDHPDNGRIDRWITARLYVGDRRLRLAQYLLLGVGGVRALRALGLAPETLHLNEGHSIFAALELAREGRARGMPWEEAVARARSQCVFTTHTPVASGNDVYLRGEVNRALEGFLPTLGVDPENVFALARPRPEDTGEFGVTPLALRLSRSANGVSRRHGRVARGIWHALWPNRPEEAVPIGHVTNGVHLPTWMAPAMRELLARYLGAGWEARASDPVTWTPLERIPDDEIWAVREGLRGKLVEYARERSTADRLCRGDSIEYAEAAAETFDPEVLTVGFARRLATYKRLYLLTFDRERALRLLQGDRPMQILIAGKAHPQDQDAKRVVQQQLFPMRSAPVVGRRVCYLEDHDLAMALELVRGCDVWVNLPRPPLEASGTSGMKSALNGGLNLSVLDGWWEEAFDGSNGWSIDGDVMADHAAQDARDAARLYDLLESEVVPLFYDRDARGIPRGWVQRIKRSLATIGPRYCSQRMLQEYLATVYPAAPPPRR
jgi:glycogen phosphorylase